MTLQNVSDSLRDISIQHNTIVDFSSGEDFLVAIGDKNYPMGFLELPYSITYDTDPRFKSISFAYLVLMQSEQDDIEGDLIAISRAEAIGEAVLEKFRQDNKTTFKVVSANAVSLREFSVDKTCGIRFELTIRVQRTYCDNNYVGQFA
jgi:hypothetical protein